MKKRIRNRMGLLLVIIGLAISVFITPLSAWADSVVPNAFTASIEVGETVSVKRTVTITKEVSSAKIDIFFLFDTTGSMGDTIQAAQDNASEIISNASKMGDVSFGVGYYQDFPIEPYGGEADVAYKQLQDITKSAESVKSAINSLPLGYGGDSPEANLYALSEVASKTSWRKDSIRIIIWFGDMPGHDGVLDTLYPSRIGLNDVIGTLKSANIIVEAVDIAYLDRALEEAGVAYYLAGQATAITNATGGKIFVTEGDISGIVQIIDDALKSAFAEYKEIKLVPSGMNSGLSAEILPVAVTGNFDRSTDRNFDFNMTYKGLAPGNYQFDILAKMDDKTIAVAKDTIEVVGPTACSDGAFIVGESGIVKIDWLYDGGKYQGQLGIFSLQDMGGYTPGSPEFITEVVNRVLSNSEQGYLVFSDLEEGARFSGILGNEIRDWNAGPYKGVKNFAMKPGSCFATVLIPNSTFVSLSQNPATTDTNKRPLFSLISANPTYGMSMGQMADVNGMGKAFAYEDKDAAGSDRDFNDLIVQITGATADLPTIDSLRSDRSSRDKREYGDWRDSAFGQLILEHVEASEITETTPHITVTLASSSADMVIYDPQKRFIGKDGGTIPGAAFEMKSGVQTVSLTALTAGYYRIVLRSVGDGGSGTLDVRGFIGSTEADSEQMPFEIAAHQSLDSILSADAFLSSQTIAVEIPGVNELGYDFNGDTVVDNADVSMIVKHWNSCRNQQKYDPFFDLNDDGCITVADVMKVLNAKTVK